MLNQTFFTQEIAAVREQLGNQQQDNAALARKMQEMQEKDEVSYISVFCKNTVVMCTFCYMTKLRKDLQRDLFKM